MSETRSTRRSSTIVLGQHAFDETKSLEELAELAATERAPEGTGLSSTIVLDDQALEETKDLEELGELAVGTDDLDIADALGVGDDSDKNG